MKKDRKPGLFFLEITIKSRFSCFIIILVKIISNMRYIIDISLLNSFVKSYLNPIFILTPHLTHHLTHACVRFYIIISSFVL